MNKLSGLIAATHTAFNADGSVNYSVIGQQAELLQRQGVMGVYICGTTGEGISCSVDERTFRIWRRTPRKSGVTP